jgi:hypothetical protein
LCVRGGERGQDQADGHVLSGQGGGDHPSRDPTAPARRPGESLHPRNGRLPGQVAKRRLVTDATPRTAVGPHGRHLLLASRSQNAAMRPACCRTVPGANEDRLVEPDTLGTWSRRQRSLPGPVGSHGADEHGQSAHGPSLGLPPWRACCPLTATSRACRALMAGRWRGVSGRHSVRRDRMLGPAEGGMGSRSAAASWSLLRWGRQIVGSSVPGTDRRWNFGIPEAMARRRLSVSGCGGWAAGVLLARGC